MTAKRIRKNAHKKIAAIFSNSTTAKAYAEDNGFVGVDVAIEWVKKMAVGRSVEYYDNQDGSYTIRIHSNLWYELYHSNYEVLKKIQESEEPIKVTGLVAKVGNAFDSVKIPNAETSEMAKWLLSWKIGGASDYAVFYLPKGVNPSSIGWTGTLLNLVDLTVDGHEYTLKEIP